MYQFDSPGRDYATDDVFHMQHTWPAGASPRLCALFSERQQAVACPWLAPFTRSAAKSCCCTPKKGHWCSEGVLVPCKMGCLSLLHFHVLVSALCRS